MPLSQRPYGVSNSPPSGLFAQTINVPGVQGTPLPATMINPGAVEAILANPATTSPTPLICAIPNDTIPERLPFKIYASGVIGVGALTVTSIISLYSGASFTLANNKLLKASSAITPTDLAFPWFLDGTAIYDSASGLMHGSVGFQIDNQLVAAAAFTNAVTGINNDFSPVAQLCLSVKFSAANVQNIFTVSAFSAG
jgi:hypothetical protein